MFTWYIIKYGPCTHLQVACLLLVAQDGWTPLYLAADRGNGEAVELLLGLGADADAMVDDPVRATYM